MRASIACNHCRQRKVRCDGSRLGLPCTNCRIDGFDCRLVVKKAQKRTHLRSIAQFRSEQADLHLLPAYIRPFPSHATQADLEYLRLQGALSLPTPHVREKLWDCYFQLVHPNLPILDREKIMSSLALATVRQTISLLLFHCVMLIAQLFLDIHENCNTDPATLHAMFERACLLFDLGWETDELTLLQSALLLSHYPLSSMAARGPTYWLSQAVSFAYALGLHQGFTETSFCAREQSLRKQLWWSVYIRERLLTLDYDQPWMIWENAYDVPMLAVEDFDSGSLLPSDHDCSPLTSQYTTYQQQRQLALVFIEKAKAATIIGRLLPISIGDCGAGEQKDQCPLPRIQIRAPARAQLDQIDRDINSWAGQLPLGIRCDKPRVRGTKADARKIIFDLNHCMLFTLYYLVTSHLAALRWLEEASPSSFAPKHAIQALWAATRPLMNLADGLLDDNLLGYFQIIGPSLIRPLLVCKMLNNRAPPWMYPILEVERIPLLIGKIGWGDPFYAHAVLSLHIGDEDPSSSSVSDTCQTAAKDDSISTPTPPNIVDAVLGGFALPSDPSPSISSFEQVFASWGVSTTTTSVARLSC